MGSFYTIVFFLLELSLIHIPVISRYYVVVETSVLSQETGGFFRKTRWFGQLGMTRWLK